MPRTVHERCGSFCIQLYEIRYADKIPQEYFDKMKAENAEKKIMVRVRVRVGLGFSPCDSFSCAF